LKSKFSIEGLYFKQLMATNIRQVAKACIVSLIILFIVSCAYCTELFADSNIKVALKRDSPFVIKENGDYTGFAVILWKRIANGLDIKYDYLEIQNVKDVFHQVQNKKTDILITNIPISSELEQIMDFSHPFFESGLQIFKYTENNIGFGFWHNLKNLFSSIGMIKPIILIVIFMFVSANLVWFTERKKNPDMFPSDTYLHGIWESFWWSAVTITTVGYGDKTPKGWPGRLFALFWMFIGIFLISFFTASISSSLTVKQYKEAIISPQDLYGKQVGTVKDVSTAKHLRKLGARVFEFKDLDTLITVLDRGLLKLAVYDNALLKYFANNRDLSQNLKSNEKHIRLIGPVFKRQFFAFAFPEQSELKERVNRELLALQEAGAYQTFYTHWFGYYQE